jgi:hypothetical protein
VVLPARNVENMWKNVGNDVQGLIFEQAKIDAKKNIVILPANICKDSGFD